MAWEYITEEVMQNAKAKHNISTKRKKWEELHNLKTPTSYKIDVGALGTHPWTSCMKASYYMGDLQIIESMAFLVPNQTLSATKEAIEKT